MGKDYYQILGLSPGAGKDEIKRAYFRLVRQYTPEKDPERFQEIREAYENLKDGGVPDELTISLETPVDETAQEAFHAIQEAMSRRQYDKVKNLAAKAVSMFGEYDGFLYYCGIAQRLSGQTGKAVKTFELLRKKYPDKPIYRRELAIAYWNRGYSNKAYAAFGEAYELGERNLDFLNSYSMCCLDRNQADQGFTVLIEAIEAAMKDCNKYKEDLLNFFLGASVCRKESESFGRNEGGNGKKALKALLEFLDRVPGLARREPDSLVNILFSFLLVLHRNDPEEREVFRQIEEKFTGETDEKIRKFWEKIALHGETLVLNEAEDLPEYLTNVGEAFNENCEGARFARTEVKLFLLENWPEAEQDMKQFGLEYPKVYEKLQPYLEELSHAWETNRISFLRDKLLRIYDRLDHSFNGGCYYEKYPQNRKGAGSVVWDSDASGTFARTQRKIGRNEPCPCGSGKKYKNCCGRDA